MRKRGIAIFLAAVLLLTGCGSDAKNESQEIDNDGKRWEETPAGEESDGAAEASGKKAGGSGIGSMLGAIGSHSGGSQAKPQEKPEETPEPENVPVAVSDHTAGTVYSQTIMIYMVGSDLESAYGNASIDLGEIQESLPDLSVHHIVVYAGGAGEWQNDVMEGANNFLLEFVEDGVISNQAPDANLGEADTLSAFIRDVMEEYDTDLYSLILWDHGGGPVCGFGVDEVYRDVLTLDELQKAMRDSVGKSGRKLEFVGFDACMMNSMEVADVFVPYANYLIASQETEPGWGWDYSFLKALDEPDMDGAAVAKRVIDSYMEFGDQVFELYPRMYADLTMSCLDLSKYQAAEEALNDFFDRLDDSLDKSTFPRLVRARGETRNFGSYSTTFDYGMVDVIHLLELFAEDRKDVREAITAIQDMVVFRDSNIRNASGVSICYPYETNEQYTENCIRLQEELSFAADYTNFLRDFRAISKEKPSFSDWDLSKAKTSVARTQGTESAGAVDDYDITLALTKEQQENFGSAGFYILCNVVDNGFVTKEQLGREDAYVCVFRGDNVEMDEDGVLHAEYASNVVYIRSGKDGEIDTQMPVILREVERTQEERRYFTLGMLQRFSDWNILTAQLQVVVSEEYPDGLIRSAVPYNSSDEAPLSADKQLLDLDDFDVVSFACNGRFITKDENGRTLDYYAWDKSDWILGVELEIQENDSLAVLPIQNPENYVCQFIIRDVSGNVTFSELIPLK